MVRVVINQDDILHCPIDLERPLVTNLETSPDAAKVIQRPDYHLSVQAYNMCRSQGRQCILNVVHPW